MKKLLSLLLTLALTLTCSLAGAENAHINAFLTKVFSLIAETDLDSRALVLDGGEYGTYRLEKSGGVTRLTVLQQGQETLIEFNGKSVAVRLPDGQGYWLQFSSITKILNAGLSMLGLYTGTSFDKLSDGDLEALGDSLGDLVSLFLERGLRETREADGYVAAFRLTEAEAMTALCDWVDRIAHDPARYQAWCKVLRPFTVLMNHFAGRSMPISSRDRKQVNIAAEWFIGLGPDATASDETWANHRAEIEEFLLRGADDTRTTVNAALTVAENGDFLRLQAFRADGTESFRMAYEGSDLVIGGSGLSRQVRVSSEDDRSLTVSVSYDGVDFREAGTVRLEEGGFWWLSSDFDGGFSLSCEAAAPFVPLSGQEGMIEITDSNMLTLLGVSP